MELPTLLIRIFFSLKNISFPAVEDDEILPDLHQTEDYNINRSTAPALVSAPAAVATAAGHAASEREDIEGRRRARGQPKGSYWESSLELTRELRSVQKEEAALLKEAASLKKRKYDLEIDLIELKTLREKENLESDRKRRKFDDARSEMLFLMCKKDFSTKMGYEYSMEKVMSSSYWCFWLKGRCKEIFL